MQICFLFLSLWPFLFWDSLFYNSLALMTQLYFVSLVEHFTHLNFDEELVP